MESEFVGKGTNSNFCVNERLCAVVLVETGGSDLF
jgi:hypothetical protein